MNRSTIVRVLQHRKYTLLLVTLMLLMLLDPLLLELHLGRKVFDVLFCLVLAATIFAVSQRRRLFWVALLLGLASITATWSVYGFSPDSETGYAVILIRHVASILFLGFTAGLVLHEVLMGRTITMDKISGAFCAYLLIGLAWGTLYSMCSWLNPGAFDINPELVAATADSVSDAASVYMYYSFITLSTLGYGDVTPLAAPVRTFAWMEAVVGQFYIAVLVARLVGLHIAQSGDS